MWILMTFGIIYLCLNIVVYATMALILMAYAMLDDGEREQIGSEVYKNLKNMKIFGKLLVE